MTTVTIELINSNALKLLKDLELINIIRVLDVPYEKKERIKLSAKLRGTISKNRALKLSEQLKQMRKGWQDRSI